MSRKQIKKVCSFYLEIIYHLNHYSIFSILRRIDLYYVRDFILVTVFTPVWLPLLLLTSIIAFFDDGRPIYFNQIRIGKNGKPIKIYKIRSMKRKITPDETDTITPFGNFMRTWGLDELPQLWLVITGELSLVGPRPLLWEDKQSIETLGFSARQELNPGLTGLAQINGRNEISWENKFKLDLEYISTRTHRLDWYILFKTIMLLFSQKGVYTIDGKIMPRLTDSTF